MTLSVNSPITEPLPYRIEETDKVLCSGDSRAILSVPSALRATL